MVWLTPTNWNFSSTTKCNIRWIKLSHSNRRSGVQDAAAGIMVLRTVRLIGVRTHRALIRRIRRQDLVGSLVSRKTGTDWFIKRAAFIRAPRKMPR